ncbi:MAG: hypothetical protein KAX49_12900, partial [Halanaerobiales bacterium]|nr:hypothetical protein [Halanaerobiales bacterium]
MAKNKITIKKNKDGKVTGIDIGNKSLKQHSQNSITSQVDPDTFLIQTVKGKDGTDGNPGIDGLNGIDGSNGLDGKPGLDGKDYNPKIEEQVNTSTKDISSAKKSIDSLISAEKTIKDDISTLDNNINIHIEDEGIHFDDLDQKEEVLEYIKNPQQVITDGGGVGPHNNLQKLQGGDPTKPKEYYHLIADDYGHIVNEDYLFRDGSLPMTGNLDMDDNHIIDPGYIQFDTDFTDGFNEGRLQWNNDCGTLEFGLPGGNVNLQIGQELLIRAKNTSGETITNGSPVYISGADGAKPTIGLASATNHIIANATIAVATEDITSQQFGYVTVFGLVRGMDTSFAVADGGPAFLSATTGELSGTLPEQPNSQVFIGVVLRKHAEEGVILVKIIPQPNLEELSDVLIDSAAAGDLIQWDNTNSRWYNSDIFNKTLEPTGFPNRTDSTIAFTAIDMTFSIQPVATSFDFYSLGVKFTSTGDTVVVDDVEGLWFFYYDSSGVLIASQTPWDFTSGFVYAAIIYWDAVNKTNLGLGEERHGITMDSATHEYLHEHFGAVWGSGFTPSVTVDGNGSLDAHCEIQSVSSGILYDEDIEHNSDEQTNSFIMLYKQSSGSYF